MVVKAMGAQNQFHYVINERIAIIRPVQERHATDVVGMPFFSPLLVFQKV